MTRRSINDFRTDLAWSHNVNHDKAFDDFYWDVFGHLGLKSIERVEDMRLQRLGADKILHFMSGRRHYIDEKKRRSNWQDILIEHYSNWEKKIPGWVEKPCLTDYIVYGFVNSNLVYLLPFLPLCMAWHTHKEGWIERFTYVPARNAGYTTYSVPVPPAVLLTAMQESIFGYADFRGAA
jgi:hypothetical protein